MDIDKFVSAGQAAQTSVNKILSDAEKATIAAENRKAAAAVEGAAVIGVDHLIDACGTDSHKLAGLALLLATAAYGFGILGKKDGNTLEQIRLFQRAAAEIQKRVAWRCNHRYGIAGLCELCGERKP